MKEDSMDMVTKNVCCCCILVLGISLMLGCSSTSSDWSADEVAGVGEYPLPPAGYQKQRLGVLEFKDKTGGKNRGVAASDEMTTLLVNTDRFQVIERERLKDLLKEQNMEGIVTPEQMAKAGQVMGAEYLCYGSVTNFEIKHTRTQSGGGFLRDLGSVNVGGVHVPGVSVFDIDFKKDQLEFNIGVDVRIVHSTTGEIFFAGSSDVKRVETASGMGLTLVGVSASSDGSIQVDNENQGKLLRMALHRIVKKMLPKIDQKFSTGQ